MDAAGKKGYGKKRNAANKNQEVPLEVEPNEGITSEEPSTTEAIEDDVKVLLEVVSLSKEWITKNNNKVYFKKTRKVQSKVDMTVLPIYSSHAEQSFLIPAVGGRFKSMPPKVRSLIWEHFIVVQDNEERQKARCLTCGVIIIIQELMGQNLMCQPCSLHHKPSEAFNIDGSHALPDA
ncbi:hypothetical protein H5410_041251 [Solanum commersonii]|uniref:Uncharacterized protein n=1 Tax=Solanum commersonii TaxID=4109 RepID=A0A9J5XRA7_SOLCO|nr:hypothetical protein H5410_041251 [Solanum commersonii]